MGYGSKFYQKRKYQSPAYFGLSPYDWKRPTSGYYYGGFHIRRRVQRGAINSNYRLKSTTKSYLRKRGRFVNHTRKGKFNRYHHATSTGSRRFLAKRFPKRKAVRTITKRLVARQKPFPINKEALGSDIKTTLLKSVPAGTVVPLDDYLIKYSDLGVSSGLQHDNKPLTWSFSTNLHVKYYLTFEFAGACIDLLVPQVPEKNIVKKLPDALNSITKYADVDEVDTLMQTCNI
ncbi:putative capsid protein [Spider associated circular virus 3]|uniref:putative capsid protein n=1 Tax=Spider associated circular virus 3 TaxID=2293304 RepID=UPI000E330997|nr:putative capsid protein [Spider associated circular virus 3]AXL65939.1 putative capsid protein [Spider associated circular virus 3]